MLTLEELLNQAVHKIHAADIFIVSGKAPACRADGRLLCLGEERIMPESARVLIEGIYAKANRSMERLLSSGDDDFSFTQPGLSRFRVCTYKQRGSLAAVIRIISFGIPDYRQMNIPDSVMQVASRTKGLVLVTGPAGSGKSTTLACVIDRINHTRDNHIITLEEPIEYLHRDEKSVISQREILLDSTDFVTALRASLRQAPDVILVGEMRDYETISTALTAAETGHLVLSTLHTLGAANTIDRVIDVFPANQQQQVRVQMAMVLQSVISQQLVPTTDGSLTPVFEVMNTDNAIRTMIRDAKTHQLDMAIASSADKGMVSMDSSLLDLYKAGKITRETALNYSINVELMSRRMAVLQKR